MTTVTVVPADGTTPDPTGLLTIDTGGDPVRIQLCLSPLCSTIASLLETSDGAWWTGPPDGWRRILAEIGQPPLAAGLACYTRYPALPRFLASRLTEPTPAFADQVEEIRRTPLGQVRRDLTDTFGEELPEVFEEFLTQPRAALDRACDALLAYHDAVVRPRWSEMRQVLTREMLRLAYSLATCGAEAALSSVHSHLAFDGEILRVGPAGGDRSPLAGRLLMLTPLICAPDGIIADIHDERVVKIGYAAPGARQVWSHTPEPATSSRQLARLLGPSRAAILCALDGPSTTSDLSARLRLAPATVSGHLSGLRTTGLVERTRSGRYVYYERSAAGVRLLELFEPL